jgi:hypothetical protein
VNLRTPNGQTLNSRQVEATTGGAFAIDVLADRVVNFVLRVNVS